MMNDLIRVAAFLNPFCTPQRVEVLFDWQDEWQRTDPFTSAKFFLHAESGAREELQPVGIPEIQDQLIAAGFDTDHPYQSVDALAPAFVNKTIDDINGALNVSVASAAATVAQALEKNAGFFLSPQPIADFALWVQTPAPEDRRQQNRVGILSMNGEGRNDVRDKARAVFQKEGVRAAASSDDNPPLLDILRDPILVRRLIAEDIQSGNHASLAALAEAIQKRALAEKLVYAEAMRRDLAFTRARLAREAGNQPMISASTAGDDVKRNRRADVRRVARDEPPIGAMFHAVRWLSFPSAAFLEAATDQLIDVVVENTSFSFATVYTRVRKWGNFYVTALRRDDRPDYFARSVQVRPLTPAVHVDDDLVVPMTRADCPPIKVDTAKQQKERAELLLRMMTHGHATPPVRMESVRIGGFGDAATRLNDEAQPLRPDEKRLIESDPQREMRDAAESIRRQHPPYDAIGITWDRELSFDALANPDHRGGREIHRGFKGYRIDVREKGRAKWESLCTIEREVLDRNGQSVLRSRRTTEGYVSQPVTNASSDKTQPATVLTMPADFVVWAGGSVVVQSPLDRLGQGLSMPDSRSSIIALREHGRTSIQPRYGREYEFRVRGVGVTGVGPDVTIDMKGVIDEIRFLRGIEMHAPGVEPRYDHVQRIDHASKELFPVGDKAAPDAPMIVDHGQTGTLTLNTGLPLAHWRVALHSRGLTPRERELNGGPEFEMACANFVRRARDNFQRRMNGTIEPEATKRAAHLSAIDPDCSGIEVVSSVWFPFSTNRDSEDRALVTGRAFRRRHDVDCADFAKLVTWGERVVERDETDDTFVLRVQPDHLPSASTESREPRILAGFHCSTRVAGTWSAHAQLYPNVVAERWTQHSFVAIDGARAIGGHVTASEHRFLAGSAAVAADSVMIDAQYAGLEHVEDERDLIAPDQPVKPPAGVVCEPAEPGPVRAEPVRWRKYFFDQDCSNCDARRAAYTAFVLQQLGPSFGIQEVDSNVAQQYKNQLAVCLAPRIVTPERQSLVLPVFTFPDATVYGEDVKLSQANCTRAIVAKIGEFGSGIAHITVTDGGSGYDVAPDVKLRGDNGSGFKAHATVENGKVKEIIVHDPGRHIKDATLDITAQPGHGSGATAVAEIGKRRLPWVDADITWTVRLSWAVPLHGGLLERPLELSAVKEFQLFRADKLHPNDKQPNKALATLTRPGRELLQDIDLDQVEFTWVDAIHDRERHEYVYTVVAVPEDAHTFHQQKWFEFNVVVPDSRIIGRPETIRALPLVSREGIRRLGIYFSDDAVRAAADHVTFRIAQVADDPMLAITPRVGTNTPPRRKYVPSTLIEVFPPVPVKVQPVHKFDELPPLRRDLDGIIAPPSHTCDGEREDVSRTRLFVVANRTDAGKPIVESAHGEIGNPFFKLHLNTFDDDRFPALAHTAASETAVTEWLQFYPDDLVLQRDKTGIVVNAGWGGKATDTNNLIWYRFHFFTPATGSISFHLSTFYSHEASLALDATHISMLSTAWRRLTSRTAGDQVKLFVQAEEGLVAKTYKMVNDVPHVDEKNTKSLIRFVALRSTRDALPIEMTL